MTQPEARERAARAGRPYIRDGCCAMAPALLAAIALLSTHAIAADWPPAPPLRWATSQEVGDLPPSISATATARPDEWKVRFSYRPEAPATGVALAGTFNGWNPASAPMSGPGADGAYSAEVTLSGGTHRYKFVLSGQTWVPDPQNPQREPDNFGGHNSVLRLGRLAALTQSPARTGDASIEAAALEHLPDQPLYFQWLADDRALLRCRTLSGDVESVEATLETGQRALMSVVERGPVFELHEAELSVPSTAGGAAAPRYTFVYTDGALRGSHPQPFTIPGVKRVFQTPEWARHVVWYQIFLDRFRNGDPSNDPQPVRPWTSDWFEPSEFETRTGEEFYKFYVYRRFYGGDLRGLEEKLPYLKALGISGIYLNPIFKAASNHKYDATNYLHVDDHFGTKGDYASAAAREDLLDPTTWTWTETDRQFLALLKKAKAMGFRVILDGVFNHVGTAHPAFVDVKTHGRKSRFADWFDVTSWEPFRYNGWAGVQDLPAFRKDERGLASDSLKRHIFDVTRRWMDPDGDGDPRDGIDGWRLDVPNEIPPPFWEEWRAHVKRINPDAYVTGEIWDRADDWLDGRRFDAVMNYPFARAVCAWLFDRKQRITAGEFDRRLAKLRMAYPAAATAVLQNLMSSHDTDRLASMAFNADRAYDTMNRVQDNGPNYDNRKPSAEAYTRARLAALVQMTYLGAPMIFYGDEAGMWGADDPTCRKPMLWEDLQPYAKPEENRVMTDHLDFYRRLIALRNENPALRAGRFRTLMTDDAADVWVFLRDYGAQQVVVAINASATDKSVRVPLTPGLPEPRRSLWVSSADLAPAEPPGGRAHARDGDGLRMWVPRFGANIIELTPRP